MFFISCPIIIIIGPNSRICLCLCLCVWKSNNTNLSWKKKRNNIIIIIILIKLNTIKNELNVERQNDGQYLTREYTHIHTRPIYKGATYLLHNLLYWWLNNRQLDIFLFIYSYFFLCVYVRMYVQHYWQNWHNEGETSNNGWKGELMSIRRVIARNVCVCNNEWKGNTNKFDC